MSARADWGDMVEALSAAAGAARKASQSAYTLGEVWRGGIAEDVRRRAALLLALVVSANAPGCDPLADVTEIDLD